MRWFGWLRAPRSTGAHAAPSHRPGSWGEVALPPSAPAHVAASAPAREVGGGSTPVSPSTDQVGTGTSVHLVFNDGSHMHLGADDETAAALHAAAGRIIGPTGRSAQ